MANVCSLCPENFSSLAHGVVQKLRTWGNIYLAGFFKTQYKELIQVTKKYLNDILLSKNENTPFCYGFILLEIISKTIWAFNPETSKAGNLVCYQCNSSSQDIVPLCGSVFEFANPRDKIDMLFVCPPDRKHFCFKEETTYNNIITTKRGCIGKYHNSTPSLHLKNGCVDMGSNRQVCFCNKHQCNQAKRFGLRPSALFFTVVILFIFKI